MPAHRGPLVSVIVLSILVACVALAFGYLGVWLHRLVRDRAERFPEATDDQLLELRRERARFARSCARSYQNAAASARREVRRYDRALCRRGITIDVATGETVADLTDPVKAWDREFHRLSAPKEAQS